MSQVDMLLVEDSEPDIRLAKEAMVEAGMTANLAIVRSAEEALQYLRAEAPHEDAERPHLILLDINLPKMTGRELLSILKSDAATRSIPVIMLTTSATEDDIASTYANYANAYIKKPVDLNTFVEVMTAIDRFWFQTARLPS